MHTANTAFYVMLCWYHKDKMLITVYLLSGILYNVPELKQKLHSKISWEY